MQGEVGQHPGSTRTSTTVGAPDRKTKTRRPDRRPAARGSLQAHGQTSSSGRTTPGCRRVRGGPRTALARATRRGPVLRPRPQTLARFPVAADKAKGDGADSNWDGCALGQFGHSRRTPCKPPCSRRG
jgi:hypothetical protein